MDSGLVILFAIAIMVILAIIAIKYWQNDPTPKGIIISLLLGALPLYLFLCFLGVMGDEPVK